jgi:alkylhydroperoxidase/carboxymuconolactone decarboxylase family protein YurZ
VDFAGLARREGQSATACDRSLVTVASLVTSGSPDQLVFHLDLAKQNGATEQELIEVITHLAFYAGWPRATLTHGLEGSAGVYESRRR